MSGDSGTETALAELWEAYRREPTSEVRELLARHYIGLVHHTAMQLKGRSTYLEVTDLLGAGSLGLLRALERFELGRGPAFSTYAVRCIRGAILDDLRERDRLPREVRARARRLAAARSRLSAVHQRSPTPAELARELDLTLERYWEWCDEIGAILDGCAPSGEVFTDGETAERLGERILLDGERRGEVRQVLSTLPPRHRQVLTLLYFDGLSGREVAEALGLTESRVSQLRRRALEEMRVRLGDASARRTA